MMMAGERNGNITISDDGGANATKVMVNVLAAQNQGFKICHLNAQSLCGKIDEFRDLFQGFDVDAIAVSETWFRNDVNDMFYSIWQVIECIE